MRRRPITNGTCDMVVMLVNFPGKHNFVLLSIFLCVSSSVKFGPGFLNFFFADQNYTNSSRVRISMICIPHHVSKSSINGFPPRGYYVHSVPASWRWILVFTTLLVISLYALTQTRHLGCLWMMRLFSGIKNSLCDSEVNQEKSHWSTTAKVEVPVDFLPTAHVAISFQRFSTKWKIEYGQVKWYPKPLIFRTSLIFFIIHRVTDSSGNGFQGNTFPL